MRILYFHQYFSTPDGSAGTRSYELARRLIDRGHEVTIVTGVHPGGGYHLDGERKGSLRRGVVAGINVVQVDLPYSNHDGLLKRSMTFLRFAWYSMKVALREEYDLLFATSTPLTAAIPGITAKWLRRKPFVFEVRDLWPELPKAMGVIRNPLVLWMLGLLERTAYKAANGLVGLSPGIVDGIRKVTGESKPVVMIPNASDTDLFKPFDTKNNPPFSAVFTGAHGLANGLDAVLEAAQVLKHMGRDDICLRFIGDGKLKPALLEHAKQEGLANCEFLDPIPKQQLAEELKNADVGLMILANVPAFYQGTSPNKFFDYLAAGLPVLNNYPGWLAGIIKVNECGVAVPPDDPKSFADALCWLADHPEECARMGRNSRQLAETIFSRDELGEKFVDFLERITANAD